MRYYVRTQNKVGHFMKINSEKKHLPKFEILSDVLSALNIPISASELHGVLCGYICAGRAASGEQYIRALFIKHPDVTRQAVVMLHEVFALGQQQIEQFDFSFTLLLPDELEPLPLRAEFFVQWCEGFVQGMTLSGKGLKSLEAEDAQDALSHITEFSQMDLEKIEAKSEEDDKLLMEVSEYTRMAVLGLYADLHNKPQEKTNMDSVKH